MPEQETFWVGPLFGQETPTRTGEQIETPNNFVIRTCPNSYQAHLTEQGAGLPETYSNK